MNKEVLRTIKFTIFSISAGIIQIVLFTILKELVGANYWISYLTSLVASVIWNFTLNKNITFKSATNVPVAMFKVFLYYLVFTPTSTLLGNYFVGIGANEYLVEILSMLSNFITEYLFDRFVVFRNSIDTISKKDKK